PAGQIDGFLRRPDPQIRAVLLFGPDAGLVRERADTLARAICPDLHDPFRVADLTAAVLAADPARLADEAAQISLMGGRRVVRLREASGAVASLVAHRGGDSLLTRAELAKLTLYAGEGGRIERADAQAVISDSAALSLDDAILAAAEGDAAALDRTLARVFQEGESAVTIIRAL